MTKITHCILVFYLIPVLMSIAYFDILCAQTVIQIEAGSNQINTALHQAAPGDTIELITSGGLYQEDSTVVTTFPLTIRASAGLEEKPVWEYGGHGKMLIIESDTRLSGFKMSGRFSDDVIDENDSTRYAMRTDKVIDSVICDDMDFEQFEYVFRSNSGAYAEEIRFENCTFTHIEYYVFRFRDFTSPPGQFGSLHVENCTAAEIRLYFLFADLLPSADKMAEILVNHCTFYNIGLEQSFHAVFRVDDTADLLIKNCIFSQTGRVVSTSQATVKYCNIRDTGGFNIWSYPVIENIFSEDPGFKDPENFDFTVSSFFTSIAIGDDGEVVGDPRWKPVIDNIKDDTQLPIFFTLTQNYPNPFNPSTTIEFTLSKSEFVELNVYNILGKKVATLVSNKLNQGNYTFRFDGRNLASGVYYYQLVTGDYREAKKMILLR